MLASPLIFDIIWNVIYIHKCCFVLVLLWLGIENHLYVMIVLFKMLYILFSTSYSSICNVLWLWSTWVICNLGEEFLKDACTIVHMYLVKMHSRKYKHVGYFLSTDT